MKNKLSRFAVPYVVWMAIFVVAPILMMVIYAFSVLRAGGFTLDNFAQMGDLYRGVYRGPSSWPSSPPLICLLIGYPVSYIMSQEGPAVPADGHGADHAAHVDELPAADLFLDDHSGKQRPAEPAV